MADKGLKRGIFITFEGPEGCGKSTQSKLLYDHLVGLGYPCIHTREPGGTKLGEKVREILLHSKGVAISALSELFLFEACRAEIVGEIIAPALSEKKIVISDRFSDATVAYQSYGGGVPLKAVEALDDVATAGLEPDLTILLDVDTLTGLGRAKAKGVDRMEEKAVAYHKRVRAGYLKLARLNQKRMRLIRVTGSIAETQRSVRREAERVIQRYARAG